MPTDPQLPSFTIRNSLARTGQGALELVKRVATRTAVAIPDSVPHVVPIQSAEG
jgi:hypothetical protein